jgi:two-component system, chemotaxis family, sensor kinase CheA
MSGLDELRVSFFQECEDLLDSLGEGLRQISEGEAGDDMETLHAVFRAVHSIKGGAGAFGLDVLVTFSHLFETVLDHMRCGRMEASDALVRTLLRAGDMLSDLVYCARDGRRPAEARMTQILAELDALADGAGSGEEDVPFEFVPTVMAIGTDTATTPPGFGEPGADGDAADETGRAATFRIGFAPRGEFYGTGNEPLALFKALGQFGPVLLEADAANVPCLADFDPAEPRLRWTLTLETEATAEEILAVFEFVTDVAEISVHRLAGEEAEVSVGNETPEIGEPFDAAPAASRPIEAAPDMAVVPAAPPAETADGERSARGAPAGDPHASAAHATIRVNLDRVDRLINLIGELVIMEAMLSQAIETAGIAANSDVSNGLDGIKQLASGIQESVMAIRAQPLKPVFQRMHRIIREASDATGKQVRLVTIGESTEVDKTVIERLVDPLTHMIRNSVDHGLEDAATRRARGKPETGTITLSAAHRSGRVIIEVTDDGAGINREKVREIAEAKGLVPAGTPLSAGEIDNLLFAPGLSSKEEVSALSGRGVGLDVVRREIQALGGRVTIQSAAGEGTTFTIALPLTLAVLEGMLVEFGGEMMVLPLSAILETLRPSSATIHAIGRTGRVVANRGELIPIIDLAEVFGIARPDDTGERNVLLLVECEAGRRAALAVDIIHDQRQVVIKSLEESYRAIPGISAATILGDGRIALIVDPEEIIATAAPDAPSPPLAANE